MTLIYLAALTPSKYLTEIIDENISEVKIDKDTDVVGITYTVVNKDRAFLIADSFRELGVKVIMGGFQASIFSDEALKHADAVVIGETELIWKDMLSDIEKKKLKRIYKSEKLCDLMRLPIPKYEYYAKGNFQYSFPIFVTRGCPYKCSFCCIRDVYTDKVRKRPIDEVIQNINYIKEKFWEDQDKPLWINFIDDNIWGDKKYTKELFSELIPLNILWTSKASFFIDDELIELAAESGCRLISAGLESLNTNNLHYINKMHNDPHLYSTFIEKTHKAGIAINTYFMVGLPFDDENSFEEIEEFSEQNNVEISVAFIYIPIPGTDGFKKQDWVGANNNPVKHKDVPIFRPNNLTKEQFLDRWIQFHQRIYSNKSIEKRLKNTSLPEILIINKVAQNYYNNIDITNVLSSGFFSYAVD